jgi:hypothetical protein
MPGDQTIGLQLHSRTAALAVVLCAISLGLLAPIAGAAGPADDALAGGCAATPSWIAAATLAGEGQGPLASCFSSRSSQAEAALSVANNRPYAQLITVTGVPLDLAESSFANPLDGALSTLLTQLSSGAGQSVFLLGPAENATLALDRPAPGPGLQVRIDPAGDNAFAVAAVTWRFLSAASDQRLLSAATRSCVASVLHGALQSPPAPERALRRVHSCVKSADLPSRAETLLRGLASRLLRDQFFQSVIRRQGTEPHPVRISLTIAASNPESINPAIQLGPADYGTIPTGSRTVEHLTATGGVPPYRFYAVPEPGGPGVPSWVELAADGTLILEPPSDATAITVPVEVVDSTGEHSVVTY